MGRWGGGDSLHVLQIRHLAWKCFPSYLYDTCVMIFPHFWQTAERWRERERERERERGGRREREREGDQGHTHTCIKQFFSTLQYTPTSIEL